MDGDAADLLVRVADQRFTVLEIDRESFVVVPELTAALRALAPATSSSVPKEDVSSERPSFHGEFETGDGDRLLAVEFQCDRVEQDFVRCLFCNLSETDQFRLAELLGCVLEEVQVAEPQGDTVAVTSAATNGASRAPIASKLNGWKLPIGAFVLSSLGLATFMPGGFADSWLQWEGVAEVSQGMEPNAQPLAALTTTPITEEYLGESYSPTTSVASAHAGKISAWNATLGQSLRAGQVIAKITLTDPEKSAQIQSIQMEWEQAKSRLIEVEQQALQVKENRSNQLLLLEEQIRQGEERQAKSKKVALDAIAMLDKLNSNIPDPGAKPLQTEVKSGEDRVLAAKLAYTLATNDLKKLKAKYFEWMESSSTADVGATSEALLESARSRVKQLEGQLAAHGGSEKTATVAVATDGKVETMLKRVGETTQTGEGLLTIQPVQTWQAKFVVPSDIGKSIRLDQIVSVRLADRSVELAARVIELSTQSHTAKEFTPSTNIRSDDLTTIVVQWSEPFAPVRTGSPMYLRISTQ